MRWFGARTSSRPGPDPVARLFVAAWPDDLVTERLLALPRPAEDGVRWSPPPNWHITLRFLGDVSVEAVSERLAHADFPAVSVTLGPRIERLGPKVVMIPVAGADDLADAVRTATDGLGRADRFDFRGHLTLARTTSDAACSLLGTGFAAVTRLTRIALVESRLGPSGSIYQTVGAFELS